jgi:hypothetical protein
MPTHLPILILVCNCSSGGGGAGRADGRGGGPARGDARAARGLRLGARRRTRESQRGTRRSQARPRVLGPASAARSKPFARTGELANRLHFPSANTLRSSRPIHFLDLRVTVRETAQTIWARSPRAASWTCAQWRPGTTSCCSVSAPTRCFGRAKQRTDSAQQSC